jgi:hypothetical protein
MCEGKSCGCHNCSNTSDHAGERLLAIESILLHDAMVFTGEDTLTQEECLSICHFAMLATSVDSQPFSIQPRENALTKVFGPCVITQALKTVMSAADEELKKATRDTFDECTENSIARGFQHVLNTICGTCQRINSS